MKGTDPLSDIFLRELAELLDAENHMTLALPVWARSSRLAVLEHVLGHEHQRTTRQQAGRLEDIFSHIGQNPQRAACQPVRRLIAEAQELLKTPSGQKRDTALLELMQRIKHHEIEAYAQACGHATYLRHSKIVEILYKSLNEERAMNLDLSELAQGIINIQAMEPLVYI